MPEAKSFPTPDSDILQCKAVSSKKRHHQAEKPVQLLKRLISKTTNEGDLVLDPFTGSGSTLIACKTLNRHYIGIEIGAEYCAIAEKRIAEML
jgi:DNA modification methylase